MIGRSALIRLSMVLQALLTLAGAFGQTAGQQPEQPVVRISVTLVQIDAVVTDSKGRRVTDLRPEDFEVRQDGKIQKITHFTYVPGDETPVKDAVAVKPVDPLAPVLPPALMKSGDVKRVAALMVDDLALSSESIEWVRQALHKYVNEQMREGDLVAVFSTSGGVGALQQFTSDRRILRAAVDTLRWNSFQRVGFSSFQALQDPQNETERDAQLLDSALRNEEQRTLEERFTVGTLTSIGSVIQGLRELPGRKSVVLFSESLRFRQQDDQNPHIADAIEQLGDLANRAGVVLYTLDPRGLPVLNFSAADRVSPDNLPGGGEYPRNRLDDRRQAYFDSQDGLAYLADQTGGLFMHDVNDIARSLREVMDDQKGYYLLGYLPEEGTFNQDFKDRKYHRVSVKLLRPGLQVRSRRGFVSVPDTDRKPIPADRLSQLQSALTSPFAARDVNVRLTSLFRHGVKRGSYVLSLLHIAAGDLTFVDEADDWHKAIIDVVTLTSRGTREPPSSSDYTYTIRMHGEVFRQALKQGFIYSVNHPIPKGGAYQMRALVRDAASGRIGSASQFIEVPDVSKGRLAVSGIVLKAAPAELQKLDSGAASAASETQPAQEFSEGHPAVRHFYQGQAILYGFQIINALQDRKTNQFRLQSQVRLFRNEKLMYTSEPRPVADAGRMDSQHVLGGGVIRLGAKMEPGPYVFQIVVTDALAKVKSNKAGQWIDFRLLPGLPPDQRHEVTPPP